MDRLVVSLDNNRPTRTYFSRRGSFRQECPANREFPSKASPTSRGEVGLSRIWGESGEEMPTNENALSQDGLNSFRAVLAC